MDKKEIVDSVQEITRLAMIINESQETKMQVFVSVSPHVSEIELQIYPDGWVYVGDRSTEYFVLRASYKNFRGKYYNKELIPIEFGGIETIEHVSCDVKSLLQEIRNLAKKEVKNFG
ncbi:hypothetical protein [Ruminococcus callidus]|uniref:hypothetical protein n=1 Tax=Ruminococcus callidus TaxID=40519 RepID=UPI003996109F